MYGISRAETEIRHQTGKRIRRNDAKFTYNTEEVVNEAFAQHRALDETGITGNDRTEGLFPANGREKINERHCSEVSEV